MAHLRGAKEIFARRWGKLRQHVRYLDKKNRPDNPARRPKLSIAGRKDLASRIQAHRSELDPDGQGEFAERSIIQWEQGKSLPQRWHLEALARVLVGDFRFSGDVSQLLASLADESFSEERWMALLEKSKPRLERVEWSERHKRWVEVFSGTTTLIHRVSSPNDKEAAIEREDLARRFFRLCGFRRDSAPLLKAERVLSSLETESLRALLDKAGLED